jgi:hypothetical protein
MNAPTEMTEIRTGRLRIQVPVRDASQGGQCSCPEGPPCTSPGTCFCNQPDSCTGDGGDSGDSGDS